MDREYEDQRLTFPQDEVTDFVAFFSPPSSSSSASPHVLYVVHITTETNNYISETEIITNSCRLSFFH